MESKVNFMEDIRKFTENMDEKEREQFLAMAEQIDREEDEFERRKVIYLSDYRNLRGPDAFDKTL